MINITIDYDFGRKKGMIVSDYLPNIREHFSIEDKSQKFKSRYNVGYRAPSRIYAITPQGRFEPRMYKEVIKYLNTLNSPLNINITEDFTDVIKTPFVDNTNLYPLSLPLRDYQKESIEVALKAGFGTVLLATSAGKTLVIATLIKTIQKQMKAQALIIVPNIGLLNQTYKDFISYGIDPSEIEKWTGGDKPTANIIITNTQILMSDIQDISWLSDIELLVIDECHKNMAKNKINKIIKKIPARLRFGFTGSLPYTKIDVWNIFGIFGNVLYTKTSFELREKKQITPVVVSAIKIEYNHRVFKTPSMEKPTEAYEEELEFLQNNKFRNSIISKLVNKVDKNILIMIDRIAHGEILLKVLTETTKKQVFFIQGSVEVEDREKVIQLMESNDDIVCIAISNIFSTGINIKNLHYIIFASIGKAKIKIIQSIGRSLRLNANKLMAYIFDIADILRYGNSHYNDRIELYKNEKIEVRESILKEPIL